MRKGGRERGSEGGREKERATKGRRRKREWGKCAEKEIESDREIEI